MYRIIKLICACALLCQYVRTASVVPQSAIHALNSTDLGVEFVPLEASTTEKADKSSPAKKTIEACYSQALTEFTYIFQFIPSILLSELISYIPVYKCQES
ncbi:unnamed protein product [Ceratitis capitata]|uniref:(Mediterranean fruit fly) hypothetical protein n=1 Tax=Ceratitis capitata TaxID=7213 RepID=A0A811U8V0_CERCA|nr:unnamed protein product [Ceratitis capitata]